MNQLLRAVSIGMMVVVFHVAGVTAQEVQKTDPCSLLNKRKIAVSDLPGLGDRSFFSSPGYGMIQLNTFKSSDYLIITMMLPGATEKAQKTAAENLMRKALTN